VRCLHAQQDRIRKLSREFPAASVEDARWLVEEDERVPVLPAAEMALNRIATLFVSRFSSIA
jgi:hypothetical protein